MIVSSIFTFVFLALLIIGIVISLWFAFFIIFRIFQAEAEDETIPILKEANKAAELTQTPVFGEVAWFAMVGTALVLLTCRAGWQNSSKVTMQLEWKTGESESEVKPSTPFRTICFRNLRLAFAGLFFP